MPLSPNWQRKGGYSLPNGNLPLYTLRPPLSRDRRRRPTDSLIRPLPSYTDWLYCIVVERMKQHNLIFAQERVRAREREERGRERARERKGYRSSSNSDNNRCCCAQGPTAKACNHNFPPAPPPRVVKVALSQERRQTFSPLKDIQEEEENTAGPPSLV